MDNPYWTSEGQRYHLSVEAIRLICFELLCVFEASKPLVGVAESIELEEGKDIDVSKLMLLRLHQDFAFNQSSKALLQLAIFVRTYDDQMMDSDKSEKYKCHLASIDQGNYVGMLDGVDRFSLRDACNKIIHANEIRPLFERIDRQVNTQGFGQDLWYLTGEIELQGTNRNKGWKASIYLQSFLELVLQSIELGDPS
jgi:hypothetical protein